MSYYIGMAVIEISQNQWLKEFPESFIVQQLTLCKYQPSFSLLNYLMDFRHGNVKHLMEIAKLIEMTLVRQTLFIRSNWITSESSLSLWAAFKIV